MPAFRANAPTPRLNWNGWRVFAMDIQDEVDGLHRTLAYCEPVPKNSDLTQVFEFLVDEKGRRRSQRFDRFLAACGIKERVNDTIEIEGRYFATRNGGASPADFGDLSLALQ